MSRTSHGRGMTMLTRLLEVDNVHMRFGGVHSLRGLRSERRRGDRGVQAVTEFEVHAAPECLVSELSFGVARRVELAGLVARNPSLLLLDEPTTGLDTQEIEVLKAYLQRRRQLGTTILVVAHDVGFVLDMCDDVYVLAEGAVIFHGSAQDARADTSV